VTLIVWASIKIGATVALYQLFIFTLLFIINIRNK